MFIIKFKNVHQILVFMMYVCNDIFKEFQRIIFSFLYIGNANTLYLSTFLFKLHFFGYHHPCFLKGDVGVGGGSYNLLKPYLKVIWCLFVCSQRSRLKLNWKAMGIPSIKSCAEPYVHRSEKSSQNFQQFIFYRRMDSDL